MCLESLELSITAAYLPKNEKSDHLKILRIKIEVLKQLVRLANESNIINGKNYLGLEGRLIEISKMNTDWLNWIAKESPK